MKRIIQIILVLSCVTHFALAKGLDEIQPTSPEERALDKEEAQKLQEVVNADGSSVLQVEKSPSSLWLEDRLSVGMGIGLVTFPYSSRGDFHASSGADIFLNYKYFSNSASTQKAKAWFRYLPIENDNKIKQQSYKSIIESYFFGSSYQWLLSENLAIQTGAELGYLLVYMESQDRFPVTESSEINEVVYGLFASLPWYLQKKIELGPQLHYAFGKFQIFQASIAIATNF